MERTQWLLGGSTPSSSKIEASMNGASISKSCLGAFGGEGLLRGDVFLFTCCVWPEARLPWSLMA